MPTIAPVLMPSSSELPPDVPPEPPLPVTAPTAVAMPSQSPASAAGRRFR